MACSFTALILAHARPQLIEAIAAQVREIGGEPKFTLDRPTDAVYNAVTRTGAQFDWSTLPVLSHRENFMFIRNQQLLRVETPYASIWDDDHLLADPAEARAALAEEPDLLYATKKYLWDSCDRHNAALPVHRSVFFFRVLAGDRFPLDRTINAPTRVHDEARRVADLRGPLLDCGYLTAAERARVLKAYKRAGKLDALTLGLTRPSDLQPVPAGPVLERMKELLCP